MLISSHTVPVPIAKVNIDGVRRVPDHLDARLKAIRRKYRQWPCPLDISLLILNLTGTYRERWRGWPCETAATGWGIFFERGAQQAIQHARSEANACSSADIRDQAEELLDVLARQG